MLVQLAVPFADASAVHLRWLLCASNARPLATMSLGLGEVELHLAVLGASHEIEARLPGGGPACVESVTCDAAAGSSLPERAERDLGRFRYRFRSLVVRLDAEALSSRARALHQRLAPDRRALVASFPGHPDALTGLAARPFARGVAWWTWHIYPASGEVVRTSTRLVVS